MIDNSSCIKVDFDFTHTFLPTVYIVVFIFGLIANCWGLKSVYENWMKMGEANIFVLNLCVADILYLLTLPFLVHYYMHGQKWSFGQAFCKTTRFLFMINLYGSIGFLTCLSVYRYLAIVHTLKVKGRIQVCHSVAISMLVWVLIFLQSLPDVYYEKTTNNKSECFDTTKNDRLKQYLDYSIVRTIIGFVIPLGIIVCCYGHVAVALATNKQIGDTILKLRCLRLVVILALLFSLCYIPYHIFRNLNLMTRIWKLAQHCEVWYKRIYIANQISHGLACLNCAINPLVYLFNKDEILLICFKCGHLHSTTPNSSELSPMSSPRGKKEPVQTQAHLK